MVDYAKRPAGIDGCWATWSEEDKPQMIRTDMESGAVKVRRRVTGVHRVADVAVTLPKSKYDDFMFWFRTVCQAGSKPTSIIDPTGTEAVWRFVSPPKISWLDPKIGAFTASCQFERLPGWQEI